MKSLRIDTKRYGWINRFVLLESKEYGYVLKVQQYNIKNKDSVSEEIHLFGAKVVEQLKDFLNKTVKE